MIVLPPARAVPGRLRPALLAGVAGGVLALLALLAAMLAGFGWLDLLRGLGAAGFGPRVSDALPLRRLAGESTQPAGRVLLAFAPAGLLAGLALSRLPRPVRFGAVLAGSVALLVLASCAVFGIQENLGLGAAIAAHTPGKGVLVEAVLLATAGSLPAVRQRQRQRMSIRIGRQR